MQPIDNWKPITKNPKQAITPKETLNTLSKEAAIKAINMTA
jgi:hypothetical protein